MWHQHNGKDVSNGGGGGDSWLSVSCPNGLADVHWLHVGSRNGTGHIDKEKRDVFIKGRLQDVRKQFQVSCVRYYMYKFRSTFLIRYCMYMYITCTTCTCIHCIKYYMYMYMWRSDCLGCAVLLCLVICLTLLAFFLPSLNTLCKILHVH